MVFHINRHIDESLQCYPYVNGGQFFQLLAFSSNVTRGPLIGYKILARGGFIVGNKVAESNNTIINDFTLLNCAGFGD